jgi:hypothetical protein
MLENKLSSELPEMKVRSGTNPRQAQIRHLQHEIDKLALLVNEAKRQSDRIQAAADALGDSVPLHFVEDGASNGSDKRARLRNVGA